MLKPSCSYDSVSVAEPELQGAASFGQSRNAMQLVEITKIFKLLFLQSSPFKK
jgi:hypothetical protein